MPRGVYDRNKSKAQRAAEKASPAPKAKRAYKKRAIAAASSSDAPMKKSEGGKAVGWHDDLYSTIQKMEALNKYFTNLCSAFAQTEFRTDSLKKAIHNTIDRMEILADSMVGLKAIETEATVSPAVEEKVESKSVKAAKAHAAPVAVPAPVQPIQAVPAPVPFNPVPQALNGAQ